MHLTKLLFFIFLQNIYLCKSTYNPIENQDLIFINLLFYAIKRARISIEYINSFTKMYNNLTHIHSDILLKIKNPSQGNPYFEYNQELLSNYIDIITETEIIFHQYKTILNELSPYLNEEEQNTWIRIKEETKKKIVQTILNSKFMFSFLYNLYKTYKYDNRFLGTISDKINILLDDSKEIFNIDFLYNFFYLKFQKLQNTLQINISIGYQQFLNILIIIEKKRIENFIKLYNELILNYFKKNNCLPKRIIYADEFYTTDEELNFD